MVGPSKILTVSYGTFSCTLEGFDNPFSTMRGIAEYFRDLTADDRYFGAEPPIPDAEMLHRIAEADAHKRVVAHVETNGVTLRQVEDDEEEITPLPEMTAAPEAQISDPFNDEPADTVALNEPNEVQAESVAAKLARIRAVVSNDNVATDTDKTEEDEVFATSPISAAFDDTESEVADFEAETDDSADLSPSADDEPATLDEPEILAETEEPEEEPVTSEDQAVEIQSDAIQPEVEEAEVEDADTATDQDDVLKSVSEEVEPQASETEGADEAVQAQDDVDEEAIAEFMGNAATDVASDEEFDAADETDNSSISRVVRMRRSDFDSAQDSADTDEPVGQSEAMPSATEEPVSSLSPEDEAELMANLAAVQRKADAEERSEKEGRAILEQKDIESSSETVSRILEVTDTEMEETEGTRRRSAIAHLKAAVAATRADTFLKSKREKEEADELSQYRDDLAQVVKPRRPSDSGKAARQAPLMLVSEQRVDEPENEEVTDGPAVLPRRVAAEDEAQADSTADNMFVESNTFANFAQEMGAHELPDLLEAAAAYSAYIQGHAHFSRPQIMQAVAAVHEDDFSREEGLRSFGMLLRRGKIKKLRRGQFTVADTTRFHPQPRAVGE